MSSDFFQQPDRYLAGSNWNLETRRNILREMLADVRDAQVLDMGCGDGTLSHFLLRRGNHVTFVDASKPMLERAHSLVPPDLRSLSRFVHSGLFEFESETEFDVVLGIGLLAHLPDLTLGLRKLRAHLRPGGRLVVQITDCAKLLYVPHLLRRVLESRASRRAYGYSLPWLTTRRLHEAADRAELRLVMESRYVTPWGFVRRRLSEQNTIALQETTRKNPMLSRFGFELFAMFER